MLPINRVPLATSRAQESTIPATKSGASTATVYFHFVKQLRDSGLPADLLVGKLKKDNSFCAL